MLTEIRLKNFKCFQDMTTIPVSNINLFTGINGRGKSTVLQALLLMRQSPENSRTTHQIIFNGSCVELGSFDDIKNSDISRNDAIELMFRFEQGTEYKDLQYFLTQNSEDEMVADIAKLLGKAKIDGEEFTFSVSKKENSYHLFYNNPRELADLGFQVFEWYNLLLGNLHEGDTFYNIQKHVDFTKTHYISADRIGPQDYYPKQSFAEFPNVGRRGEYTANVLAKKKAEIVYDKLCIEQGETRTVLDQTEARLSEIFDGGKITIEPLEANIVLMRLNSEKTLNVYKPINVGFGYSYALPIIVSGLIAQEGERLIIENPEAHLHPYAQSQIAKFGSGLNPLMNAIHIPKHLNSRQFHERPMLRQRV